MKQGWSQTRPNGQPIEPGTFCWIIDLEDGTHPIPTYGKTVEEVTEKLSNQNANAQAELARRSVKPAPGPSNDPPPARRQISADQVMQATADLTNPAKAGEAIATLLESSTGVNVRTQAIKDFGVLARAWQAETPEFYAHPGNIELLGQRAVILAGGNPASVTRAHFDKALQVLSNSGMLFEAPPDDNHQPSNSFPDESQVQRTERPRGTRFATGARSTSFQRQPAMTRTPKYSEAEIRRMPIAQSRALIDANDKDYADSCDYWFSGKAQATA